MAKKKKVTKKKVTKKKPEKDNGVWMLVLSVAIMISLIAYFNK